jgi:ornithine--oxo-acid transaminase
MSSAIEKAEQYGAKNYLPLDVVITKAERVWVWDEDGNKYLDMLAAYSAVNQGHCHPKIVKAAKEQLDKVTVTSRAFHNDRMGDMLEKLCNLAGFEKALPMNSGAEAVETAIKAVRKWGEKVKGIPKDKGEIIAFKNNFHGRTTTIISFTSDEQYKDGFGPLTPGFKVVDYNSLDAVEAVITPNTAAILAEPIQGEGGVIIPDDGYLKGLRKLADDNNILLVFDEIQTGLGRTGKMFAFQHEGVRPDVLCVGKALSGGISPISAMLSDHEVMDVFGPGDHGSTFGGNPFASAVAIAALDVLVEEDLPKRAEEIGAYFVSKLKAMNSPHIKEIRARGLMIGVEVTDDSPSGREYCLKLMDEGILSKETHDRTIRFTPPLVITKEEIDWAMERIAKVFA